MKNRSSAELTLLKAFVLAVTCEAAAHAGLGYLPLLGPPPLRVQAPANLPGAIEQLNLTADTNFAPAVAAAEAANAPSANANSASGQTNSPSDLLPLSSNVESGAADPYGTSIFSLASPDLLNITPQMLAAYFHPVARGTNTATEVVVPMPVIFTPPQNKPGPSSRAEFIVK